MSDPKESDKPSHEWSYRQRFPLQDRMLEVVKLSKEAAEAELAAARVKLRKLMYGS